MIEMESSNKTQLFDKHACGNFSRYWYPKPSNSWRWNTGASYSVWTSEIYEFGKYTREYGFYPKQWNLLVFTDNSGPPVIETFNRFKLNHDALATLLNSPELVRRYKKETKSASVRSIRLWINIDERLADSENFISRVTTKTDSFGNSNFGEFIIRQKNYQRNIL